jgi:uridine phosphorylase
VVRTPSSTPLTALPLFTHALEASSAFTPDRLMDAVRSERRLAHEKVPPLCVLDFDGDVSDRLSAEGVTSRLESWACFHTSMGVLELDGVQCGVVPRTIGGPYAVLVAEQLHAAGARLIVGLTSAGRISQALPLPSIVVVDSAVRDEGTSLHYVTPEPVIQTPARALIPVLAGELAAVNAEVRVGRVWTTDAPYRETAPQIERWASGGVLAVEMQAAALFAFAQARGAVVAVVALVSNGPNDAKSQFDTGGHALQVQILSAIGRAAGQLFASLP